MKFKFNVNEELNECVIEVNPEIFPLKVIMQTAYQYINKAMILIDGNPSKSILVSLKFNKALNNKNLKEFAIKFNNELITKFIENNLSERYAESRNAFIKAALNPVIIDSKDNSKNGC